MNYDPNLVTCGKMVNQLVRLTFAQWECRKTVITEVEGNCLGFEAIDSAVLRICEEINGVLVLESDSEILTCEFCQSDRFDEVGWLKDMLIGAEILAIKPENQKTGESHD